jgi:glycosyltransferase involved in cell wall biosynthesis
MKSPKLVFIVDEKSHFSLEDIALLQHDYKLIPIYLNLIEKDFIRAFNIGLSKIIPGILKSDISLTWFVDYHAVFVVFFSKLFRKKSIVIVGGHEICNMPEINYGYQRLFFRGFIVRWVLKNATCIVVPSRSYSEKVLDLVKLPSHVVPLCSEPENYALYEEKMKSVVMVANQYLNKEDYISLKGIATYNKVAKQLIQFPFYLIGRTDPQIKEIFPNLIYLGEMNHDELIKTLAKSKVYCQLSFTESFGVSLLESLQSGCIPVVTDKDGMKELVQENGYKVPYGDVELTIDAVRKALHSDADRNEIAKQYQKNYSKEKRRIDFKELIESMYNHKKDAL